VRHTTTITARGARPGKRTHVGNLTIDPARRSWWLAPKPQASSVTFWALYDKPEVDREFQWHPLIRPYVARNRLYNWETVGERHP
jgi:hypothetical protein